jgi:DNA polymerase (family 10)
VFQAASDYGCFLEVDGQPDRLDLNDAHLAAAKAKGVRFSIDSDAHSTRELSYLENGVAQARRGGLTRGDVVNTRPLSELRSLLRKK